MQLPKRQRGAVTENRSLATGEYRRHPAPPQGEAAMADRVDAQVDAMQMSFGNEAVDGASPVSEALQLPHRHHSVLPARQLGQTWWL